MSPTRVVVCTGGFDPIHKGHVKYFEEAKKLGDILLVGVNSDDWLVRKKGKPFMDFEDRVAIVNSLKPVAMAFGFDDSDGSARDAIYKARDYFPMATIVFANGGDRTAKNIPEMDVPGVSFVFGVGGEDKANSSSWILQRWEESK